jgi:enoyl-CoA hydratase/carnithine racemase
VTALRIEDRGDVRWIIFNRPERLNALQFDDVVDGRAAVLEAASTMRAVVLTGVGDRAFSAGIDLDTFLGIVNDPATAREQIGVVKSFLDAVRTAEIPTIAALNGHCLGGAFELALACDFRVARKGALLGLPEIKLGLPCIMESALLSQFVGLNLAKEMMLTGELHSAQRMERHGLLRLVEDRPALDLYVDELLKTLTQTSRAAIGSQKRLFELWQNRPFAESSAVSVDEIVGVFEQEETQALITQYSSELRARRSRRTEHVE